MKEKILIAGGTGFIGYHLTKKLKKNYLITILSSHKVKANRKVENVKYIICDVTFKNKLQKILKKKKFDHVINLSGYVNHSNKKKTFLSHYNGCKNLANVFLKKPLKSFIQFGSGLEYGRKKSPHQENNNCFPVSNYGKAKLLSTKYIMKKLSKYIILRLYQVYGPHQKKNRLIPMIIESCLKNKSFACTEGSQLRDFLFVEDLNDLILKILKKDKIKSGIYNVGSSVPIKVKDVINQIINIIRKGKPLFGKLSMRKDESKSLYPKITKIKKTFSWKPNTNISKGLKKTIKFYEK